MKIYFAKPASSEQENAYIYTQIAHLLGEYGEVLFEELSLGEGAEASYIYERNTDWLRDADVVIAEVTTPSLDVGYEIGLAESHEKRIICIYREQEDRHLSSMIAGNRNLSIAQYESVSDLENIFADFF